MMRCLTATSAFVFVVLRLSLMALMLEKTPVLSFQQVSFLPRSTNACRPFSFVDSSSRSLRSSGALFPSLVNNNKYGNSAVLHAVAASSSSASDDSPGWVVKGNQVVVWAIIAAGINLAYILYNRLGVDTHRAKWISLGILTQTAGFLVRSLIRGLRKVTNKEAWLRNLVIFQSVGLSFFSHGVFGNKYTGSLIGVSLATSAWALKRERDNESAAVSYPLLTSLRVNELVQVVAAKRLFVPVLTDVWPRLSLLSAIPVSVGALVVAILPSCLQFVGGVAEGDYAEADKKEEQRLTGNLLYLASFLLLTVFSRELSVNLAGSVAKTSGLGLAAGKAGKNAGRGLFSRSGSAAGAGETNARRGLFSRFGDANGGAGENTKRGLFSDSGITADKAMKKTGRGLGGVSGNGTGKAGNASGFKLPFDVTVRIEAN